MKYALATLTAILVFQATAQAARKPMATSAEKNVEAKEAQGFLQSELEKPEAPKWMSWALFKKIYVNKLQDGKLTDEKRLAIVTTAGRALEARRMALTPDQLLLMLKTFDSEESRYEALLILSASARYNTTDIAKITSPFDEKKADAHGLLFALNGYGGY